MVVAERVRGSDGNVWIKVEFEYNDVYYRMIRSIDGSIYVPHAKAWAVPDEQYEKFVAMFEGSMLVWKGQKVDPTGGGIPEEIIPSSPIPDNYEVVYEGDQIISSNGFKTSPFGEFQVKGFNALYERDFLILSDEPGLGKSWQILSAMEARMKEGDLNKGLIVCKASLLFNWRDEVRKHSSLSPIIYAGTKQQREKLAWELLTCKTPFDVLIISYDTLRVDIDNVYSIYKSRNIDWCALDEGHVIKNPNSKIGKTIHEINTKCKYVVTATPIPNNPLEIYNYLKWGKIIDMPHRKFINRYGILGGFRNRSIVGFRNILELRELMQKHMLRRLKKDKLKELPDITFKRVPIQMTAKQLSTYEAVKEEIKEELASYENLNIQNPLTKLLRLQQVTGSLELLGDPPHPQNSAKLNTLDDLLEELTSSGEKVIVFSKFKSLIDIMEKRYKNYNPAIIHGEMSAHGKSLQQAEKLVKSRGGSVEEYTTSERQKQVYKFQEDVTCKIALLSTTAAREGLTLTAASTVVFIDNEWNWAYKEQAFSRAHRIGQKGNVTVIDLICEDTVDEYIYSVIMNKKSMAEFMIDQGVDMSDKESISNFITSILS